MARKAYKSYHMILIYNFLTVKHTEDIYIPSLEHLAFNFLSMPFVNVCVFVCWQLEKKKLFTVMMSD